MSENNINQISCERSTEVYSVLIRFFDAYFKQRSVKATLELISDTVFSIGTGENEVAIGKEEFKKLLNEEIHQIPNPIIYEIDDFFQRTRGENGWDCYCKLRVNVTTYDGIQVLYSMRLTVGMHIENDKYIIDILHASEASQKQEDGEYFPMKFISQGLNQINKQTGQELMNIMTQLMPGGIVGGYMEEGFPLFVANEKMLSMMGYDSYEEFDKNINGMVINSIHEDDQAKVNMLLDTLTEIGDQYEIEYRIQKKDGNYFWVHDIGRLTVDANDRAAIISILVDISSQVTAKKILEKQALTDALTGILNRKAGMEQVELRLKKCQNCMFFIIDIDNFKNINDIYGHQQGDVVLQYVAQLMKKFFYKSVEVVYRLGGDEFVIFISDCDGILAVEKNVQAIIDSYYFMVQAEYPLAHSTLSVGGIYTEKEYTLAEIYKEADGVLYTIKKNEKGRLKLNVV